MVILSNRICKCDLWMRSYDRICKCPIYECVLIKCGHRTYICKCKIAAFVLHFCTSSWRDNRLTGVVHLNLHFWAFISFNWACREIRRRASCGDVKLPGRQLPNTSMTDKPGDNRPCSSQNASSMNRRLRSPLNHPSFSCHVLRWARPT